MPSDKIEKVIKAQREALEDIANDVKRFCEATGMPQNKAISEIGAILKGECIKGKEPHKWQNPENPSDTCSNKGKKPAWFNKDTAVVREEWKQWKEAGK